MEKPPTAVPGVPLPLAGAGPEGVGMLRKDPYRLFFPLGVLLGWWGVGQWLLFSLGLGGGFRVVFHAMVQVQGFLGCFVAGFLFTFIPRRTATEPPAAWQLFVAAACPVLLAALAWRERWDLSQIFWFVELAVLFHFVAARAARSRNPNRAPPSLVWIPAALAIGFFGAGLTAFSGTHALGRALVLEAMVGSLVMGIGAMLIPVITRAEPPPAQASSSARRAPQVLLVALFVASFALEAWAIAPARATYAVRLAVVAAVLVRGARLWRWPTEPGLNRRVVFAAAWCLPLGYALLTAWPSQRSAGLHVIFLGGFGLLALTVGQHVVAAHAGQGAWLSGWPRATWGVAGFTAVALAGRLAMQLDPPRYLGWMTVAAVAFVAAGGSWLVGMAPMLTGKPVPRLH